MKVYDVELHIKGYEIFPTVVRVLVRDNEHPALKAIRFHVKHGWNVDEEEIRIDKIIRKI